MICATCGGEVFWKGLITDLTETQCNDCGAINNQITHDHEKWATDEYTPDQGAEE